MVLLHTHVGNSPDSASARPASFSSSARGPTEGDEAVGSVGSVGSDYTDSLTFRRAVTRTVLSDEEVSHWLLGHIWFLWCVDAAVLSSAVQMGVQAQIEDHHGEMDLTWFIFEQIFTAIFVSELTLKLWLLRRKYFCDVWNLLDFGVVLVSMSDAWVIPIVAHYIHGVPKNQGLGSVRSLRLLRLLRLLRIMKLLKAVPELVMVIEGMASSLRAIMWVVVLLMIVVYVAGIICVDAIGKLEGVYPDRNANEEEVSMLNLEGFDNYMYFGRLDRSMLTIMNIILLAEWADIVRPLAVVQPHMVLGLVVLVFTATFGVFNVIIGVVVQQMTEAMEKAKENDKKESSERARVARELGEVMYDLDMDGDGALSGEEICSADANRSLQRLLAGVKLPQGLTFTEFHEMLDVDGDGSLSREEFVQGTLRLIKGDSFQHSCLHHLKMGQIKRQIHAVTNLARDVLHEVNSLRTDIAAVAAERPAAASAPVEPLPLRFALSSQASANARAAVAVRELRSAIGRLVLVASEAGWDVAEAATQGAGQPQPDEHWQRSSGRSDCDGMAAAVKSTAESGMRLPEGEIAARCPMPKMRPCSDTSI